MHFSNILVTRLIIYNFISNIINIRTIFYIYTLCFLLYFKMRVTYLNNSKYNVPT